MGEAIIYIFLFLFIYLFVYLFIYLFIYLLISILVFFWGEMEWLKSAVTDMYIAISLKNIEDIQWSESKGWKIP